VAERKQTPRQKRNGGASKRRTAQMGPAGDAIGGLINHLGMRKDFKRHLIFEQWAEIVGEFIAWNVRPVRIEMATLYVAASSPPWANELMMMQLDIIAKINRFVGENLIKYLRTCSPGADRPPTGAVLDIERPSPDLSKSLRQISLTDEEIEEAREECAIIADEKLRASILRTTLRQKQLVKLKAAHGWHKCASCTNLCPPQETYCRTCNRKARMAQRVKIRQYLIESPWARFAEIEHDIPGIAPALVNDERTRFLQHLLRKVKQGDTESIEAKTLVMLYRSMPPEQITDDVMRKTIYKLRRDLAHDPSKPFQPQKRYEALGLRRKVQGKEQRDYLKD